MREFKSHKPAILHARLGANFFCAMLKVALSGRAHVRKVKVCIDTSNSRVLPWGGAVGAQVPHSLTLCFVGGCAGKVKRFTFASG